jgi:radical SAM superfamily enzyme YgiQ (UPF0313 family)
VAAERDTPRPAVVLVADRTLSAGYRVLLEGMFATMQTTRTPWWLLRRVLSPPVPTDGSGRAAAAPLGLRRVEASLLADGRLGRSDVVCTTPEALPRLLGPWTRAVGISSGDPLGGGMSNTTTRPLCGGRLYTQVWTERMLRRIRRAKRRHGFGVLAGGPGAWQWAHQHHEARRQGIDVVFEGPFERRGPGLLARLLDGRDAPPHVRETATAVEAVRPIRAPSVMGVLELSRGCGRGCRFCASAERPMDHLPERTILADLAANIAGGATSVVCGSEDVFRYGARGGRLDFERLRRLLERMREVGGRSFMQIDHANVTSVLQLSDAQLREVRRLLGRDGLADGLWLNLGAESANGALVAANAPGKIAPFRADDWPEMVRQAAARLTDAGFFPLFSIILGLPGETPADVRDTLALVRDLARRRCAVLPIFHEPVAADARAAGQAFGLADLRPDHLELFAACYQITLRRLPRLMYDNQRAGGVGRARRALLQGLGRGERLRWRRRFRRLRRRIERTAEPAAGAPVGGKVAVDGAR